jgi:hypothetical protein
VGIEQSGWLKRERSKPSKGNSVVIRLSEDDASKLSIMAFENHTTNAALVRSWIRNKTKRRFPQPRKQTAEPA